MKNRNDNRRHFVANIIYSFLLICLVSVTSMRLTAAEIKGFAVVQVDPLMKVFGDTFPLQPFESAAEVAKGENVEFQIALRADKAMTGLQLNVTPFVSNHDTLDATPVVGYIGYVHVEHLSKHPGDDAYRPVSKLYPDPFIEKMPLDSIAPKTTQTLWVSMPVPLNAIPGVYNATATVTGRYGGKRFKRNLKLSLIIYNVALQESKLWVSNWSNIPATKKSFDGQWHDAPYLSAEWWGIQKATACKLKDMGNNVVYMPLLEYVNFKQNGSRYSFDFSVLDSLVRLYRDYSGMKMLEAAPIATRSGGGWYAPFVWMVPYYKDGRKQFLYEPAASKKAQTFYKQFLPQLMQHLSQSFPDIIYAQHIADEPIDENSDSYNIIARIVKKVCPDIKIIEATQTEKVSDIVDIEVPQLDYLDNHFAHFADMKNKGHQVWCYTCWLPQGNYANRFIEQPLLKTRILPWIAYRYGIEGILHWAFNRWNDGNPYLETTNKEGDNILPGGDAWITYPSASGKLYGSLRFEAFRDGIADYSLLTMLGKVNKEKADSIARNVIKGWNKYNISAMAFRNARHECLVTLQKQ